MEQQVMEQEAEVAGGVDVGRIVHVCLGPSDLAYGQLREGDPSLRHDSFCRPAIVVRVWGLEHGYQGAINAVMLTDGSNDAEALRALGERSFVEHSHQVGHEDPEDHTVHVARTAQITDVTVWRTSVAPGHAVKIPGTWHWPRLCKQIAWADRVKGGNIDGHLYHIHRSGMVDLNNCLACKKADN